MSHRTSDSPIIHARHIHAVEIARDLTRRSAEGLACTDRRRRSGVTTLTFAPAPDEPMRLFATLQWDRFWKPVGWDFAFSDKEACYISRPLPSGTVTATGTYAEEDFEEEQALLADHAARGLRLVAVRGDTYYFVPAEPAAIAYTVAENPSAFGYQALLTPPAAEPDEHGRYFLCMNETGRCYFADVPSPLPPREGDFLDYDGFCDGLADHYRDAERTIGIIFGLGLGLALLLAVADLLSRSRALVPSGLLLVSAILFGALLFGLIRMLRREHRRILAGITSEADYPTTPPPVSKKARPAALPATDACTHLRTLKRQRLIQGVWATFSIGVFLFTVYCLLTDSLGENIDLLDAIILLVALPFSTFGAVSRFRSLSRKIREMTTTSDEKDDPHP